MLLPSSAQEHLFTDKIIKIKLPALHCFCYEHEILWQKNFAAMHRPVKSPTSNSRDPTISCKQVTKSITIVLQKWTHR